MSERESMPFDVVIVGAGPAGLAAAIRLKQLAAENNAEIEVCVIEKGSEVGAHILSGAVIDPRALDELLPDWREQGCPMAETPVTENHHWVLSKSGKFAIPHLATPGFMHNKGTYTGSLGNLCRWLAEKAEELEVQIFPGFAAAEILYNEDGSIKGVATGDMGIGRDGEHKADYTPVSSCTHATPSLPKARAAILPRSSSASSIWKPIASRRPTVSASRSCGTSTPRSTSRAV